MPVTFQECVERLVSGEEFSWGAHGSNAAGKIKLDTPGARRLFDFLVGQNLDAISKGDESLFPGLIEAWDNEGHDPKDALVAVGVIAGVSGFRLAEIETEGFGGLNLFGGPALIVDINRKSWCLEGQNGSGKTSLASSIIWGITGRRIVEHSGPKPDDGVRKPVMDAAGNQIGTWPPLASYPSRWEDLAQDVRVRVKLTFRDAAGDEALVERIIVSRADGTSETEKQEVDPRLLSAPLLLESGILMPSRMAHINLGEGSQPLYEAVKALTGLDQLGAVGDGAATFTHGARRFLKYAKDNGIDKITNDYLRFFEATKEPSKDVAELLPANRTMT